MDINKKRKIADVDWDYFRNDIPINEVIETIFGDENPIIRGRFRCPCPDHNDRNPSASINVKANTWKCWSCGESGTPLDLVMMAVPNLDGSSRNAFQAATWLDTYYPGAITYHETIDNDNELQLPIINNDLLKKLGLKTNPFYAKAYRDIEIDDENKVSQGQRQFFVLDSCNAARIVLEKISEYEQKLKIFSTNVLNIYPQIDKEYILKRNKEMIEPINALKYEMRRLIKNESKTNNYNPRFWEETKNIPESESSEICRIDARE